MTKCINYLPSERVRVFISSAQRNENGFVWSEVRKRIKESLKKCVYLNPFIIEDTTSATPSNQFFQRQIERTDVIVLLVKSEVRVGTAKEYTLAKKLKKPLLIYFVDDGTPNLDVINLKKDIQTADRCTYRIVPTFDNIETIIQSDLMDEIVRAFQDRYFVSTLENESPLCTEIHENTELISSGIPSKTEINKFISCYNYFFDLLNLSYFKKDIKQTELHKFGCSLLSWLITGKWEIGNEEINDFISKCSDVFPNSNWLEKRWDAIKSFFQNNLEKTLIFEEKALESARENKKPDWIINNILIDCRNIEGLINNLNQRFLINSKYQNELSAHKTIVCLPVLDRYLNNIYELIEKDEFKEKTATPYTQLWGSNISNALTNLANYLFTAAIYGSLTHLLLSRQIFANILSRYAKIHAEPSFMFFSLKQYVLDGNVRNFKLYLDSTWDSQYSFIASQADTIWELTNYVPVTHKEDMKISIFASLGSYLSDDVFFEASKYVLDYSNSVSHNNSEPYFEAILANLQRMNPEQIINVIIPIITKKCFHSGDKLSRIISSIDLRQVDEQSLRNLSDTLMIYLPSIISNNGSPQMIAPLVERSKDIFGKLETIEGNGLSDLQESLYKINRGSEDWYPVIKKEIDSARIQFEKNNKKGVFHGFAYDPYSMISVIIRNKRNNKEIDNLIFNDFIPLSLDVLNSDVSVQTKGQCIDCLCEVLSTFKEQNIKLPTSVKQALQTVDVEKGTEFFSSISRKALEIRVLMAQIITGVADEGELLHWCIEYESLENKEKIVIINCLEKYLYHKKNNLDTIDSLVVSIVLQCYSANHQDIRKTAVKCLAYLVSSNYHDVAINELNKAIYDSSHHVRNTLLNICKNNILPTEVSDNLISLLRNDANYNIRFAANELQD